MKASDSTNSLTELTQSQDDKSCFICLESGNNETGEPLVDSKLLRNCGCRFSVHPLCWNIWIKEKSDYDCPICHKDSMLRMKMPPNPVLSVVYEEQAPRRNAFKSIIGCLVCSTAFSFLITAIVLWGN
jgi:E3 ubiquitin-protein ligase DOA10